MQPGEGKESDSAEQNSKQPREAAGSNSDESDSAEQNSKQPREAAGSNSDESNSAEQNSKQPREAAGSNSDESNFSGSSSPKPTLPEEKKAMSVRNRKRPGPSIKASAAKKPMLDEDDDESSDDSTSQAQEKKSPSPEPVEPSKKLPEELLKTLYKPSGVLLISGLVSWDLVARREYPGKRTHPNLYTFHKFTNRRYRLIVSGCTAGHSILVTEDGDTYTFGRNTFGQLGLGDTVTRSQPELIPQLVGKNIIHAAVGKHHTLFVTDKGAVYACGDNKCGQCGVGGNHKQQILTPTLIKYSGAPIVKVGCGAEFSMILDCNGHLHSFGMPEYGQLGHNSDGKYFVTATKMSYHFETVPKQISLFIQKCKDGRVSPVRDAFIVDVSCGNNHTVAIDSKKRAYSWGFGGFGRLGHAEQKDETVPRLIKYFDTVARGVHSVYCGGSYSLAINDQGALYMFGQTKRTGEANMYPKPVHDLSGWSIKSIGTSNTSIVIAAEDTLIAWGVSPTYGELGLGDINKSSAQPKEVSRMKGLNITQVAMGFSHTLLLCDDSTEEAAKHLAALPTFEV